MKKFLVTLIVIILAVSVGFGVFFLVRDTEVISLGAASLYKDVNDSFEVSLDMKDPNSYTTVEVTTSDNAILEVVDEVKIDRAKGIATGTFKAVAGGNATITFKTNNAKFRNITCDVIICDGSETFPFRVDTAEELEQIGTEKYPADKCYTLNANIDLGVLNHTFNPIKAFSGVFDGAGYTLSNLIVRDASSSTIGLFESVSGEGVVKNVKFDGAVIEANGDTTSAGVVTGDNYGTVKLIEVMSSTFKCANPNTFVGGIAGRNISTNETTLRQVARIDRCSANVQLGTNEEGVKGTVGGLTGLNKGGIVINSYAKGDAYAKDVKLFGGLVGENTYLEIIENGELGYNGSIGAKVKDCYSVVKIHDIDSSKMGHIVAKNTDSENLNKFVGNYYLVREGETELKGCGSSEIVYSASSEQYGTTAEYETSAGLKTVIARVSYKYYEKMPVVEGNKVVVKDNTTKDALTHYWNTSVWAISGTKNDGYPILTYKDEYADDNFDNSTSGNLITSAQDLKNIEQDMGGAYFINSGVTIELGDQEWIPIGYGIGSKVCIPFTGSLTVLGNSNIEGLKITQKVYEYAGLFGVIGAGGEVSGVVMTNVNITTGNTLAGAIAGQNNGSISAVTVNNGTITAGSNAGAIAGENKGKITSVIVTTGDQSSLEVKTIESTIGSYSAGGVVGLNFASSEIDDVTVSKNVKITSNVSAYLGGVAGYNEGYIGRVLINVNKTGYGVITSAKAFVGGIAGYSTGSIFSAYVKSATISASTSDSDSCAGGIAGAVHAAAKESVDVAVVEDVYISAYYAGGIAAKLNTTYTATLSISQDSKWDFDGNMYVINISDLSSDFSHVCVESATTIAGNTTGGFVAIMRKGIISNSYVKATLSGSNNAGFAWTIAYDSATQTGAVIYDSYSACKATGGTSYAVSNSEIHNTWKAAWIFGNQESDRTVGVVFDYSYVERDNMIHPTIPNALSKKTYHCKSDSDMKKASTFDYLSIVYWTIVDGSYPTNDLCEGLKGNA